MDRRRQQRSTWPPLFHEGETVSEKKERLKAEAQAKSASEIIDQAIEVERQRKRKETGGKILLLGQAESGKSTVLKNFQILFAPKAFEREAALWRPVIHLNLVRSMNFVITLINSSRPIPVHEGEPCRPANVSLSPDIRKLCARLLPLRQLEENLVSLLSGYNAPPRKRTLSQIKDTQDPEIGASSPPKGAKLPYELIFPSQGGWKSFAPGRLSQSPSANPTSQAYDAQSCRILAALADEMVRLWEDLSVQSLLKMAEIRLDEQPGFFLDQILQLAREDYVPRPEDILKARVTTIGPEEHIICAESEPDASKRWMIYDVGGCQSQRGPSDVPMNTDSAWAQFFDDVNVIIFLAPMSGFNQVLAEDESINRLTDSLRLWHAICSNKILADVEFVLFLNKLDILESKLTSGIVFSSFVTSYTGKNETKPVAKYLLDVFVSLHQQNSPKRRKIHPHLTCAVDMKATSSVIYRIKELILTQLLTRSALI